MLIKIVAMCWDGAGMGTASVGMMRGRGQDFESCGDGDGVRSCGDGVKKICAVRGWGRTLGPVSLFNVA